MRISLLLAAAVALFGALLLLGETEKLPDYQTLKQEHALMAAGGYDLVNLASPRLFGAALKVRVRCLYWLSPFLTMALNIMHVLLHICHYPRLWRRRSTCQ